jgi:hypothetical protein
MTPHVIPAKAGIQFPALRRLPLDSRSMLRIVGNDIRVRDKPSSSRKASKGYKGRK